MKRCIGTVAYPIGSPHAWDDFGFAFAQMVQFTQEMACKPGEYIFVDRAALSTASIARNRLVERMQGQWLFQTDSDHEFEPDVVLRLLAAMERYNADVVSGFYVQRQMPHAPLVYRRTESGQYHQLGEWPKGIFKVDAVGAGCLLVRKRVFQRIIDELGEQPFDPMPGLIGEDLAFFERCHRVKIDVLCDPRVEHPHLGVKGMTSADFASDRVQLYEAS